MRTELQISAGFRLILVISLAVSFLFFLLSAGAVLFLGAAIAEGAVIAGKNVTSDLISLFPATLFATLLSGVVVLINARRLTRPSGFVEIRPDGIALCCYSLGPYSSCLAAGFVDWSNLAGTGLVRAQSRQCLGVRFNNLDAFLSSSENFGEKDKAFADCVEAQFVKIVRVFCLLTPYLEPVITLMGFTELPKSAKEKDMLAWNLDNYGWHVMMPDIIIPRGPESVRSAIEQHRFTEPQAPELSVEARLQLLNELLQKGLITGEELQTKKWEILAEL